jgi:quinohemoprotein ethanol dehydrogenase
MSHINKTVFYFGFLLIIGSCGKSYEPGTAEHIKSTILEVDDERLVNADATPGDWMSYGRNYSEDRYSPLNQITKANIKDLGLAWSINLGTTRGIEATPIVVDGIMYLTGPWSMVYAIDARKGKLIWTYDPEVPREYGERVCCDVVNRGVAVYRGLIFVGSLDGRLIAIAAETGKKVWEILTVDKTKPYSITGAPRVVDGKVIIGNGGAEFGTRGYVTAYDALTGNQMWRFYTVPGDPSKPFESKAMEEAAKTWMGEWWKYGGGGTAWDAMAYDPDLKLLYIGTGNGSPWNREVRSPGGGDNLYLSSIVALNPDSGELVWYYQTTPGDTWDYTATQHIILGDLQINGVNRKVLMQAPKNGFFYVLDRINGKLISAKPYVNINWATAVDSISGRPMETSFSRYISTNSYISPSYGGGHNWQPMAFNPKMSLVYIPARRDGYLFGQDKDWKFSEDIRTMNGGIGFDPDKPVYKDSLAGKNFGTLVAWDPITQKQVWSVKHATSWNAGVLTTDDLVFQGTAEGNFIAYDAKTGEKIWQTSLETGIVAAPITYMVEDVQYISIAVGWGGAYGMHFKNTKQINPGTVYTFAIGKKEPMPVFPTQPEKKVVTLPITATEKEITQGRALFNQFCSNCHNLNGGGSIPDLTFSTPETLYAINDIVRNGAYLPKGMPKFEDRLSEQDVADIKQYILSAAKKKREEVVTK